MPKTKKSVEPTETPAPVQTVGISELAQALQEAINASKPIVKKTPFNRVVNTPWTPKDGSPKLKLKRKMYQHGLLLDADILSNAEIDLLNRVKPGNFMDGNVHVVRRRDRGIDVTYQVKTAAQRLKLVNTYGIRNLVDLLQRCLDEADAPKNFANEDE